MAKKTAPRSDKFLTLFQGKTFTILFFLGIFSLFGGAFYLMQTSAAKVRASVSISSNGCQISAVGTPGDLFEYGAYGANKGGGSTSVTLPSSGTYTATSGGAVDMTSYGKIMNRKGRVVASAEKPITANCF